MRSFKPHKSIHFNFFLIFHENNCINGDIIMKIITCDLYYKYKYIML